VVDNGQSQQPSVNNAVFSKNGERLATTASEFGGLRLWEVKTGKEIVGGWNAGELFCSAVAFSPVAPLMAVARFEASETKIEFWDHASGNLVKVCSTYACAESSGAQISAMAFCSDGKTLVAAACNRVDWFEVATGKKLRSWIPLQDKAQARGKPSNATFLRAHCISPNGKFIAIQVGARGDSLERQVVGFDLESGKEVWQTSGIGFGGSVDLRIAFSGDDKRVAIGMLPNRVEVRDNMTGKIVRQVSIVDNKQAVEWMGAVSLSSNGQSLAIAADKCRVFVCRVDGPANMREFAARPAQNTYVWTECVAFAPNDAALLVAAGWDLQLYDVATFKELLPCSGHRGPVCYVTFSSDGTQLLTGSGGVSLVPTEVAAWDVGSWNLLRLSLTLAQRSADVGIESPDRRFHIRLVGNNQWQIADPKDGRLLGHLEVPKDQFLSARGFFSPLSHFFVLAGQDEQGNCIDRLYAVPSGKVLCQLPRVQLTRFTARQFCRPVAFSSDGRLVAVLTEDKLVQVVDTMTGNEKYSLGTGTDGERVFQRWEPGGSSRAGDVCFSGDCRFLACWLAGEDGVRIWDMKTGTQRLWLRDLGQQGGEAHLALSPDGRLLAIGNRKIEIWELATGKRRRELVGHRGAVLALAFSPDSRLLASGSLDSTVIIWDLWSERKRAAPAGEKGDAAGREPK
jgi:WD40 repeat protein